eukprot:CAMPEP_0203756574 /NCGR_PEP_ID=MMETSP0098-20131031/9832_1 /ASSEMBLY_ACC=CAM_ASM_000208 /TAXON_ID=96639 /ORGANISM=" , Strain NY0313808BC1" /LENGTH=414 /DNA_ID=CAMNT_0050648509 /DNA_START=318 /DNA_END=1562 /DNA_ORIENTATION=-
MVFASLGLVGYGWIGSTVAENERQDAIPPAKQHSKAHLTEKFAYYTGTKLNDPESVRVFAGTGNPPLAQDVSKFLGVELGKMDVSTFADGEISIKVNENVRGKHVVIVQSTCPPNVNDNFVELLLMVSTMRRSSAKKITVVMPYCAYARSDSKKGGERKPIAARSCMQMLETVGADTVVCVDMHSGQMQGFLTPNVPSDNITAIKVGALYFSEMEELEEGKLVVVAPNSHSVARAKDFWNVLLRQGKPDARFAMVIRKPILGERTRIKKKDEHSGHVNSGGKDYEVVGEDYIRGCDAIIVQDIIDSADSLCNSARALKTAGARRVYAFGTHGLFSGQALERIDESPVHKLVVANTASSLLTPGIKDHPIDKIEWISVAPLIAETIRKICEKESLSPLFKSPPTISAATSKPKLG